MEDKEKAREMAEFFDTSWRRHKKLKTASLLVTFCSLGLSASVVGPTLVSMEYLLDTDTKKISAVFTGGSLGYLVGNVVCGLLYDRMNKELIFTITLAGIAGAMMVAPFSPNVIVFVAMNVVQTFFMGIIDAAGQSYLLKLWEGSKHKEPLMQSVHGLWSLGATISPFICRAFLTELPDDVSTTESPTFDSNETTQLYEDFNATDTLYTVSEEEIGLVRLAYVLIGAIILVSSILFLVVFFLMGPSCRDRRRRKKKNKDDSVTASTPRKSFTIGLLALMFVFYVFYLFVEGIPGNLIAVFVVKGLGWSNNNGALITSIYWGSHGIGRLIGIPLSSVMSSRDMLIMDFTTCTVGFALLFLTNLHNVVVWLAVAVVGLGMGSVFASGVLLTESYIELTGAASAVLLAAASVGGMIGPVMTASLMAEFGYQCFVYVCFASIICQFLTFCGVMIYVKYKGQGVTRGRTTHDTTVKVPPQTDDVTKNTKLLLTSTTKLDRTKIVHQNSKLKDDDDANVIENHTEVHDTDISELEKLEESVEAMETEALQPNQDHDNDSHHSSEPDNEPQL